MDKDWLDNYFGLQKHAYAQLNTVVTFLVCGIEVSVRNGTDLNARLQSNYPRITNSHTILLYCWKITNIHFKLYFLTNHQLT